MNGIAKIVLIGAGALACQSAHAEDLFRMLGVPGSVNTKTYDHARQATAGMSKADVIKLAGEPGNKQTHGNREAWQYCQTGMVDYSDKYVIIFFQDDKVAYTDGYTQSQGKGPCKWFYRPVKWQN